MTEKEKRDSRLDHFAWDLVYFLRYPQPFEVGSLSINLKDIIRGLTKGNRTIR